MATNHTISIFKRANHSEKVLTILKVYLQRREMCDIVIIAGIDGVEVPAHRILLSACSLYFLNLFTNLLDQYEEDQVTVPSVSGSSLIALTEYCYSGVLEIRKDNVKTLSDAAYLLQMDDVYRACQDYFVEHLDASNSLQVVQTDHSFKDVQLKAQAFIHKNYMEICKTEEFARFNIEQLCKIIASDELVVDTEEEVFNSCVTWVNDNRVERDKYFHQLLALVRLPLLSPRFLTEHVKPHSLCQSGECKELIFEAMSWHLNPKAHPSLNSKPRLPCTITCRPDETIIMEHTPMDVTQHHTNISSSDEIFVAIGSNKNRKILLQCYDNTANEWIDWNIELSNQWLFVCAMVDDTLLIVEEYGSLSQPGTVKSYNFKSKTQSAQRPLRTPRSSMGCAVLDGCVYIVAGYDGVNRLNTVERWDPKTQTWTYVAAMATKRYSVGVAALGKYLYAVGGISRTYDNSVERYDPETNNWITMASMNMARLGPGLVAGNGYLYAIGGNTDESNITSTVERFDPVVNKWTMICSIGSGRREIGCAFLGNRLLAVGGHNGLCWQSTAEEYDIETNKWTVKKPFNGIMHFTRLVKIAGIHFADKTE